jgi:AraC family transcriptional regulator
LFAEETMHQVMHRLLQNYNGFRMQDNNIKGGLSSYHMRQIKTLIQEQIADKHSIELLAAKVNLSPFHFARMFKESFGESPAAYITRKRIDEVKRHLGSSLPLSEVSLITGFSQQSHMTKNFKVHTGMTPARYRQLL